MKGLERALCFIGLVMVGLWVANYAETYAFQSAESERLDRLLATARPAAGDSAGFAIAAGSVLGRLEIPRLHISAMIAEGIDSRVLQRAVGHVRVTSRPGQPGNMALAGHRDTFFRGLGRVRSNDVIRVVTAEATYLYRVRWQTVVPPRRTDLLDSTATPSLTLVTCYPFDIIGRAPDRFVVRAEQVTALPSLGARNASPAALRAHVRTRRDRESASALESAVFRRNP